MDWRDGGRVCFRRAISWASATTQTIVGDYRQRGHTAVHNYSRHQCLRRSQRVVVTEEHRLHDAFVCEHDQVSAVVALPADDAWTSDSRARILRVGRASELDQKLLRDVWSCAAVF